LVLESLDRRRVRSLSAVRLTLLALPPVSSLLFPLSVGASLGTGDLDTGTGKEGDVEAKCISEFPSPSSIPPSSSFVPDLTRRAHLSASFVLVSSRTRLSPRPNHRHLLPLCRRRSPRIGFHQEQARESRMGQQKAHGRRLVEGELFFLPPICPQE